jgi:hypothetical protein
LDDYKIKISHTFIKRGFFFQPFRAHFAQKFPNSGKKGTPTFCLSQHKFLNIYKYLTLLFFASKPSSRTIAQDF